LKMPLGQPQRASEAVRRARALRARPPASEGLLKRYRSHIFTYLDEKTGKEWGWMLLR
jgi:hypothetical protein